MASEEQKGHEEDDGEESSIFKKGWDKLVEDLNNAFVDAVPSDEVKAFHPKYFYPLACLLLLTMTGIFAALFVPTMSNEVGSRFLAPLDEDGPYCDTVTISNTGQFLATKSGYWAGSDSFSFSESAYSLTVIDLQYTTARYESEFLYIREALKFIGNASKDYNLGTSLLFWMSYVLIPPDSASQRFNLHADPLVIFDREKVSKYMHHGNLSNSNVLSCL
jgi:hypothetical protein